MLADVRAAVAFLTIFPTGTPQTTQPGRSFAYYPLVGLLIGGLLSASGLLLQGSIPAEISAFFALAVWVLLTGGLHLDGFGDSCDGLLAAVDPQRRLEIMKDPQAGSWAVIGLILLLLGKWLFLQQVTPSLWWMLPVIGRLSMVLAVGLFPYARASGLGAYFRTGFGVAQVFIAAMTTLILIVMGAIWIDPLAFALLVVPPLTVYIGGRFAAKRLGGGITGDVYGGLCELTELLGLIVLAVGLV